MHGKRKLLCRAALSIGGTASAALAGPFAPAAGEAGSTAVWRGDPALIAWATTVEEYWPGSPAPDEVWQMPSAALGPAEGDSFDIVSLGDGGMITLTFDLPIADGPGFDFAIFENGFSDTFLELAWVEVSDGGAEFVRFANRSLTPEPVPFIGAAVDPTDIDGLAGKYRQGFGTPFDLADVGLSRATHVRIIDIVGDGSALDSTGAAIYDPFPTAGSVGFDLDAVGVIHQVVPEPGILGAAGLLGLLLRHRGRRSRSQAQSGKEN